MESLRVWLLPFFVLLAYFVLLAFLVPALLKYLKRKAGQSENILDDILILALERPIALGLVGIGLKLFFDAVPLSAEATRYSSALMLFIFALAGYFFFDNLLIEVVKRYSKKLGAIATSAGILKTFCRLVVIGFIALIILER